MSPSHVWQGRNVHSIVHGSPAGKTPVGVTYLVKTTSQYLVKRDSREQQGWTFPQSDRCLGTEVHTLKTGDYTLEGYENDFIIERKRSTGELAQNLFQERFHRELERMESFKFAYLFFEFEFEDIVLFPSGSGIPNTKWRELRMTPQLFMKRIHELQIVHPTIHILFVGRRGREVASSLFKRITEAHAN